MIRRFLLAIVMVLGTSLASHAGMLACGPIYGNTSQWLAVVFVYNAGSTPVTIQSKEIISQLSGVLPLRGDALGTTLNPGVATSFDAYVANNCGHAARIIVDGSAESVCAVLEMRGGGDASILANTPLRPIR